MQEVYDTWVQSLGWEDPWRREWQPNPVFVPKEFHRLRSLAGYGLWGRKESDMTEATKHAHTYEVNLKDIVCLQAVCI